MKAIRLALVFLSLAAGLQSATAALVAKDSRFGNETIIDDSTTGLSWLRLDITRGTTYGDVLLGTEAGGLYEGFRIASIDEVEALFDSIVPENLQPLTFFDAVLGGSAELRSTASFVESAMQFTTLFGGTAGTTPSGMSFGSAVGHYANRATPEDIRTCRTFGICNNVMVQAAGVGWFSTELGHEVYGFPDQLSDINQSRFGTYLVAAPIPEPSTFGLLLVGLSAVGLAVRSRKYSRITGE